MALSLQSADQFLSFAISMIAMQFSKKPFMLEPKAILALRIAFGLSIILQVLFAFLIRQKILKTNDQKKFKMKSEQNFMSAPAENQEDEVEISYFDYDLNEVNKMLRACLLQGVVVGIIHFKWNVTQPLLIQSTAFIRNLLFNSLYRAHIYGMTVIRPFDLNLLFPKSEEPVQEPSITQEKKKKKED